MRPLGTSALTATLLGVVTMGLKALGPSPDGAAIPSCELDDPPPECHQEPGDATTDPVGRLSSVHRVPGGVRVTGRCLQTNGRARCTHARASRDR